MGKSYESVVEEIAQLFATKSVYDKLIECGIAKKDVHFYVTPDITSGYSMGEEIVVKCNDVAIESVDNTQQYAKSCTWRPKHGYILLNFTKKDLKTYVALCKERATCSREKLFTKSEELKALCVKSMVKELCVMNKNNKK